MLRKILKQVAINTLVVIPLMIAAIPILSIALLFIPKSHERLPRFLRWFDNGETYYKALEDADGLMGPDYYRIARGTSNKDSLSFFKIWWERLNWLAFRNPIDYFAYAVLGYEADKITVVETNSNLNVGDHVWSDLGVYKIIVMNLHGKEGFEYYLVKKYPGLNYGLRMRFGWKIRDPAKWKSGEVIPWVVSISPFMKLDNKA